MKKIIFAASFATALVSTSALSSGGTKPDPISGRQMSPIITQDTGSDKPDPTKSYLSGDLPNLESHGGNKPDPFTSTLKKDSGYPTVMSFLNKLFSS